MKNNTLGSIDIASVDSLESYILHLGLLCLSVDTLSKLQDKALSLGIFDADETEMAKTLQYQALRLFQSANDLLRGCTSRTQEEWPDLMQRVVKVAKNAVKAPKKKKKKK